MGTALRDCLLKEVQDALHPQSRRNLASIFLKVPRAPQHHNSNLGDMTDSPPERNNDKNKEGEGLGKEKDRQ